MATIHDLPAEILCDVFTLVYGDEPDIKTSIILSSVCGQWHDITCDLRYLWSDIRVASYDADILDVMLTRSKGSSVNIKVDFQDDTPKGTNTMLGLWRSLIAIASEMGRCRRLSISAPSSVFKLIRDVFGSGIEAPVLYGIDLKCVDVVPNTGLGHSESECTLPAFDFDPDVLEDVSLDGVSFPFADLSRVKALSLKNMHAGWLYQCLPAENELEFMHLANSTVPWGGFFSFPELQHLILEKQDSVALLDAYWDTPVLTDLTLVRPTANFWEALAFVLKRTPHPRGFEKVQKLTLVECDSSVMAKALDVGVFIDAFPAVELMEFTGTSTNLIVEGIKGRPNALQNLKKVIVDGLVVKGLGLSLSYDLHTN